MQCGGRLIAFPFIPFALVNSILIFSICFSFCAMNLFGCLFRFVSVPSGLGFGLDTGPGHVVFGLCSVSFLFLH